MNGYLSSATAVLILSLSCTTAFASDAVESDCVTINKAPNGIELPAPSLSLQLADHGLTDSAADMKAPAKAPADEKLNTPALAADAAESSLTERDESTVTPDSDAAATDELPKNALRLPGVSDEELPRFRRQMYRTDI